MGVFYKWDIVTHFWESDANVRLNYAILGLRSTVQPVIRNGPGLLHDGKPDQTREDSTQAELRDTVKSTRPGRVPGGRAE